MLILNIIYFYLHPDLFSFSALFNISDKVMLSIDILLEWREHFRRGVPVTVMIEAKIASIIKNHKGPFIIYTLGGGEWRGVM